MSAKERIQIVREAIENVKKRANKACEEGHLIEFSNLTLDLGALEQCLDIETDRALKQLEKVG